MTGLTRACKPSRCSKILLMIIVIGVFMLGTSTANLINRIDGDCIPPPVPQTDGIADEDDLGTPCRMHAGYSQVDIAILIDATGNGNDPYVKNVSELLKKNFVLTDASYGPINNDFLVMAVANKSEVKKSFNEIASLEELQAQFSLISTWKDELGGDVMNLNGAFLQLDSIFNWENKRGKIIFVVANVLNSYTQADIDAANALKTKGAKIFVVQYAIFQADLNHNNTQVSEISTHGWYETYAVDNPIKQFLYSDFFNSIRQASCICLQNTQQFFTYTFPYTFDGHERIHYYADCVYHNQTYVYGDRNFDGVIDFCRRNISVNSRVVALSSFEKLQFAQLKLAEFNVGHEVWTGWNISDWVMYDNQSRVDYQDGSFLAHLQSLVDASKDVCENVLNLGPQNGELGHAALYPYNNSYVVCFTSNSSRHYPFCEIRALDTYDNPKLCRSPFFINSDTRPSQIGFPCSQTLQNTYLDILVISDVSNHLSRRQLDNATKTLMEVFKKLNLNQTATKHSSRISLITFATLPTIQLQFNDASNFNELGKKMNLSKYWNVFDGNRNAESAFVLAKSMMLLKKSYRRPVVVFISSGFKNSDNPDTVATFMKTLFNAAIITISTTASDADSNSIAAIADPGFDLSMQDNQLPSSLKFALTQANCFCPSNTMQLIATDPITKRVTYFRECLKSVSTPKSTNQVFESCSKFNATPVAVTNAAKAKFIIENVLSKELYGSPIFALGIRRNELNVNLHFWSQFSQDPYQHVGYPPKLNQYDNLDYNCSMAVVTSNDQVGMLPIECDQFKLPFICQLEAFDANNM